MQCYKQPGVSSESIDDRDKNRKVGTAYLVQYVPITLRMESLRAIYGLGTNAFRKWLICNDGGMTQPFV